MTVSPIFSLALLTQMFLVGFSMSGEFALSVERRNGTTIRAEMITDRTFCFLIILNRKNRY